VVLVFLLMTGGTRARRGLESLGLVTVLAVHLPMPPLQPKRRAFVIETHGLPRGLGMAFVTGRPLASLVRVLARMAVVAGRWRFAVALAEHVAFVAFHLRMSAPQGAAIGNAMVERLAVKPHEVCVAALVLGMAGLARSAAYCGRLPMVPPVPNQIRAHVLVARQAEPVLPRFVERFMALETLALVACVLCHDLTRHDQ
jgi:hypothetical protein